MKKLAFIISVVVLACMASCSETEGCMDPKARNYNSEATKSNFNCEYSSEFYSGTWNVTEYYISACSTGTRNYNTLLAPASSGNVMQSTMSNFCYLGNAFRPVITFTPGNKPLFEIVSQSISAGGHTYTVDADGHAVNDNYLMLNYHLNGNGCYLHGSMDLTR